MAHPGGRPLKFQSVEELQEQIAAYFANCDPHPEQRVVYEYYKKTIQNEKGEDIEVDDRERQPTEKLVWQVSEQKPYLITGLAVALNTSRDTLIDYSEKPEFFDTVKAAKDKCQAFWELLLIGNNATGPIFNLKNNYGWSDKSQIENSGEQKLIIETRQRAPELAATTDDHQDD